MKRWHFAGQRASHGNTKSHRRIGSIGQRTSPGKVWKGKKMPGRMGGGTVSVHNMRIVRIDVPKSLIYLKGSIPGTVGTCLTIKDALMKIEKQAKYLQYPTFIPKENVIYPDIINIKEQKKDPSEIFRHENNVEGLRYQKDEDDDIAVDEKGSLLDEDEGVSAGPTAENKPE